VIRIIILYKDSFINFYKSQDTKIQQKIEYVLDLVRFERRVPIKFYKLIDNTSDIWEIRVITTFKSIRILCFPDKGDIVVLTNCFIKKTKKTPPKEIEIAKKLKKEYLNEKYGGLQYEKH
jgi:phage-related protein